MPRYLALDYLSQAVSHRRCQLESMMVAPPHHMEIVGTYAHKGQLPDPTHWIPWTEQGASGDVVISCSLETVGKELKELTGGLCGHFLDTMEELTASSESEEMGSEVDLFSQDIASAMRDMGHRETWEDYPVERFCNWGTITGQECIGECVVESPESPNRMDVLLSLMPSVDDLSSRLKPKLIQDPFVDETGRAYSHEDMFRSDVDLEMVGTCSEGECKLEATEEFRTEPLKNLDISDVDPLFDLIVPNEGEPLSSLSDNLELPVVENPPQQSPVDVIDDSKDLSILIKEICKKCPSENLPEGDQAPDLVVDSESSVVKFSMLNNQDVSSDSDDSGIGQALLESPLLPPSHVQTLSPLISRQVALLEPIPMSPEGKTVFLSPCSERELKRELWRRESVFDTILTTTLPYPETSGVVGELLGVTDVVSGLFRVLEITELKINGECELDLPWDPLAGLYREMELAEGSLHTRQPSFLRSSPLSEGAGVRLGREEFSREELMDNEIVELPLRIYEDQESVEMRITQTHHSHYHTVDQAQPSHPQLITQARPSHSHTITQLPPSPSRIHPKDSAWNLLLQSTSTDTTRHLPSHYRSDLHKPHLMSRPNQSSSSSGRMSLREGDCPSGLDMFLMLRSSVGVASGGVKRKCGEELGPSPLRKKSVEDAGNDTLLELDLHERAVSPSFLDICLSGSYLSTVLRLEQLARELCDDLRSLGLRLPSGRGGRIREIPTDSIKFLLKQQLKLLEDSNDPDNTELCLKSCRVVTSLYLTLTVLEALFHCSLGVALVKLTTLCDKYQDLLGGKEEPVKKELLALQLAPQNSHPKLLELMRLVTVWRNQERGSLHERGVVVVESEFPTLSGEILDMLQSIPGLKCCVFSLIPDSSPSQLYLKTVEDRFQLYDCLVVPALSLTEQENFPWEKVTLLVEYEQLHTALFSHTSQQRGQHGATMADRLNLRRHVTLRAVEDLSSQLREISSEDLCSVQYTLVASERVVANTQLLQLLETRHNTVIVERDFQDYKQQLKSRYFAYSDVLIDHCTGVLLRPVSVLSSDRGVRTLINTLTALSFQLQTCWAVLYTGDESSYPYGGSVPSNLARLHASVAHYCPKLDQYCVRVITTSGTEQVASWIRRLTEMSLDNCKGEKVLMSFPCLNSYSALGMLKKASLSDLFQMTIQQLQSLFPWMPLKISKMFHSMCHLGELPEIGEAGSAFLPSLEAATDDKESTTQVTSSYFPAQPEAYCLSQDSNCPSVCTTNFKSFSEKDICDVGDTAGDAATNNFFSVSNFECTSKEPGITTLDDSLEGGEPFFRFSTEEDCKTGNFTELSNSPLRSETIDLTASPSEAVESSSVSKPSLKPTQCFSFSFEKDNHSFSHNPGFYSNYFRPKLREPTSLEASTSTAATDSTAMRLLSSSKRLGKTPSQKQIRDSVLEGISKSTISGAVSASSHLGYISSSAVRNRGSHQTRTPVKSLDLGFAGQNPSRVLLQSNDRTVGSSGPTHEGSFNQSLFRPDFLFRESTRSSLEKDFIVPSHMTVSPLCRDTDSSLFDSPEASVALSPAKKRRLSCQKDPNRSDGQTKLILF